jgi:hypothetical protein
VLDRDCAADNAFDTMSSRLGLSSDVSRTRCLPLPSAGGRDERRDQNHVARRATSVNTEEGLEEDSRAAFQRCRSATSHRLRFYRESRLGIGTREGMYAPPAHVGCLQFHLWLAGMPPCSQPNQASGLTRPWCHLQGAWLFPYRVVSVLLGSRRSHQVRRHYGTTGLSRQGLVRQEMEGATVKERGRSSASERVGT